MKKKLKEMEEEAARLKALQVRGGAGGGEARAHACMHTCVLVACVRPTRPHAAWARCMGSGRL